MNNKIKYEDLCTLISNEIYHSSPKSVDKYLKATYKIILEQLQLNNSVYLKDFGTFEIKNRKSGSRIINNPNKNNEKQLVYVEPKLSITFKASSVFDHSVNENDFKLSNERKVKVKGKNKRRKHKRTINNYVDLINKANLRKVTNNNNG